MASVVSYGKNVVLTSDVRSLNLQASASYFADESGELDLETILTKLDKLAWISIQEGENLGFDSAVHWFYISFQLDTEGESKDWLINVDYPMLDQLQVYFVSQGQVLQQYHLGDSLEFSMRPISHRSFLFELPKTKTKQVDLLLRVKSEGSVFVPIHVWERNAFWESEQLFLLVKGSFFGLLIVMIFYNLIIYFIVKDQSYFYYVAYTIAIGMFQLSMDGLAFQYLWPNLMQWHHSSLPLFIFFAVVGRCLFCISFLELEQRWPLAQKLLMALVVVALLLALVTSFIPFNLAVRTANLLVLPSTVSCLVVGLILLMNGVKSARYFVAGWTVYFVGVIAFALAKIGLLQENLFTQNALQVGVAIEIVMFSWALADRINFERQEKMVAQKTAIENLLRFKSIYDHAIEGMLQCTMNGTMIGCNATMAQIMGYSDAEEFVSEFNKKGAQSFLDYQHFSHFRSILQDKGKIFSYEIKGFRRDGQPCWLSVSAKMARHPHSKEEQMIEGFVIEITQRKQSEEQLQFLSSHDPLTGLVNRREFESRLKMALESVRYSQDAYVLLYLDLDQFKLVNDTCGHVAGDELLRKVTSRIRDVTRGGDTVARLSADEFGILLSNCSIDDGKNIADKIRKKIQDLKFSWQDRSFNIGGSIGLVELKTDIDSVIDLINRADASCEQAKTLGRNRVHVFDPESVDLAYQHSQMLWAARISESIEKDYFQLYVQPIMATSRAETGVSYEVLLRLKYDGELVFPGTFLPAAERYNMMPKLDRWVIKNTLSWMRDNEEKMAAICDVSINLSGLTLGDNEFPRFLRDQFERFKIQPEKICFEITETIAVTNLSSTIKFIEEFRELGCSFSLDDFGSGFSSYGYLKNLPVDYLKIDGGFVKDMETDEIDRAMVESINRIGHVMGKKTIAEFVENENILELLKTLGVDYAQGYGIAKPFPIDDIKVESSRSSTGN